LVGDELEARLNEEDFPGLMAENDFQEEGREKSNLGIMRA
jgi:hypothetical protein